MKFFLNERKLDANGRLCLPKLNARALGITNSSKILIYLSNDGKIIIKKYEEKCLVCGNEDLVKNETDIHFPICADCLSKRDVKREIVYKRYTVCNMTVNGRILIPNQIRKVLDIPKGTSILIYNSDVDKKEIILEINKKEPKNEETVNEGQIPSETEKES